MVTTPSPAAFKALHGINAKILKSSEEWVSSHACITRSLPGTFRTITTRIPGPTITVLLRAGLIEAKDYYTYQPELDVRYRLTDAGRQLLAKDHHA